MVEVTYLSAEAREPGPRSASRALRNKGRVPGIIYGGGKEPQQVSLDVNLLRREIDRGGFANRLVDLQMGGNTERVLPREVQVHPISDWPIHVDFLRLSAKSEVRLSVPVVFENEEESPGIKRGGLINVVRHEVELICRADSIPENLVANLAGLEIGDSVHISNIDLPENVRPTITERDFTIATVASPTIVQEQADGDKDGSAEDAEGSAGQVALAEGGTKEKGSE